MEISVLADKQKNLIFQRNISSLVAILMLFANVILSICLISAERQTHIVPAGFSKELVLGNKRLSVSYLEEMTAFYLELLLGLTEGNIDYSSNLILRHIHPSFYSHIASFLEVEQKRYKEYRLSTHFKLSELKIDDVNLIAEAKGLLISYYGNSGKSEDLVSYRISYDYSGGILSIKDFSIIKDLPKK
jgi:type IV conjugative transfer system protein TraE